MMKTFKEKSQILIVDDQQGIRELLGGLLADEGYILFFAENGLEALDKAASIMPDLVLLDVMMPELDGFEVCRRLRANPLLAAIPVIMLTALEDYNSRLQGIEAGADDFITKPFNWIELQARVRNIAQLNRYRQLHIERRKFKWVVNRANEGYLILSQDDHILYANAQAYQYLGLEDNNGEKITETFSSLVADIYYREPQQAWLDWPHNTDDQDPIYLIRSETETTDSLWLQVDQTPVSTGSVQEHLIHLKNVTASVMAERLMWTFQGHVSHKLRTPIGALTGFLTLLESEKPTFSKVQEQYFSAAYESAIHLQKEIQRILRYQEIYQQLKVEQIYCNLGEILERSTNLKESLDLEIVTILSDDTLNLNAINLPLSADLMEIILHGLMDNAKKFHPQQNPSLEIKFSAVPSGIKIEISDDGLTLLPEQLAKMWTPYYQVEKHFTGQVTGMGLGLSTVAALLWEVGGTYRAFNRLNGPGVVIELTLPVLTNKSS